MNFNDALLTRAASDILQYGWHCVGVSPTVEDPEHAPFTYSVGFHCHKKHPELIIVGLPVVISHSILYDLYERVAEGERFAVDDSASGIIENFDLRFRPVPADGRPLNVARAYFNTDELPVLQVIWPDESGLFPDEEGCDPRIVAKQDLQPIRAFDAEEDQ